MIHKFSGVGEAKLYFEEPLLTPFYKDIARLNVGNWILTVPFWYKQVRSCETWLNPIYLGSSFVFRIDRRSVFYRLKQQKFSTDLYRIPVYSGFGLDRFQGYSGFGLDMFPVYSGFSLTGSQVIQGSVLTGTQVIQGSV